MGTAARRRVTSQRDRCADRPPAPAARHRADRCGEGRASSRAGDLATRRSRALRGAAGDRGPPGAARGAVVPDGTGRGHRRSLVDRRTRRGGCSSCGVPDRPFVGDRTGERGAARRRGAADRHRAHPCPVRRTARIARPAGRRLRHGRGRGRAADRGGDRRRRAAGPALRPVGAAISIAACCPRWQPHRSCWRCRPTCGPRCSWCSRSACSMRATTCWAQRRPAGGKARWAG